MDNPGAENEGFETSYSGVSRISLNSPVKPGDLDENANRRSDSSQSNSSTSGEDPQSSGLLIIEEIESVPVESITDIPQMAPVAEVLEVEVMEPDQPATYERRALTEPLLPQDTNGDTLAALAVWIMLLRFTGDLPEPERQENVAQTRHEEPTMNVIFKTLGKRYTDRDLEGARRMAKRINEQLYIAPKPLPPAQEKVSRAKTVNPKWRLGMFGDKNTDVDEDESAINPLLENRPTKDMDKVRFIIGQGILRPALRDEIYSQLCKHLTENLDLRSRRRGWLMFYLCVGCFAPSSGFMPLVQQFLSQSGTAKSAAAGTVSVSQSGEQDSASVGSASPNQSQRAEQNSPIEIIQSDGRGISTLTIGTDAPHSPDPSLVQIPSGSTSINSITGSTGSMKEDVPKSPGVLKKPEKRVSFADNSMSEAELLREARTQRSRHFRSLSVQEPMMSSRTEHIINKVRAAGLGRRYSIHEDLLFNNETRPDNQPLPHGMYSSYMQSKSHKEAMNRQTIGDNQSGGSHAFAAGPSIHLDLTAKRVYPKRNMDPSIVTMMTRVDENAQRETDDGTNLGGPSIPDFVHQIGLRLKRTVSNGERQQPSSWLELIAARKLSPIQLPIWLPDKSFVTIAADSASTASEICLLLCEELDIRDTFGFSLYIGDDKKMTALGFENNHIMDGISQFEQQAGGDTISRNLKWKLYFRKEIFTPWDDPSHDPVATDLVYKQVTRGIKSGEYICKKEEDLSLILAQRYHYECGPELDQRMLEAVLPSYLPNELLNKKTNLKYWVKAVSKARRTGYFTRQRITKVKVKEDLVEFTKRYWTLMFSRYYEAFRIAGPSLPKNEVILAVNWEGIYVVDLHMKVLLSLPYTEVTSVSASLKDKMRAQCFNLVTVRNEEYSFTSHNTDDIIHLVTTFLQGLKQRSRYVVALKDYTPLPNQATYALTLKRGDLIVLEEEAQGAVLSSSWGYGENMRNRCKGKFLSENVYVLPAVTKPSAEVLMSYTSDGGKKKNKPLKPFKGPPSNAGSKA